MLNVHQGDDFLATSHEPSAEIISIGTEILLGEITDTNSVYIAQALRDTGVNLYFMTSVGDNERRITSAIQVALSRADIVITTGGLGPTVDDMTRQAVAAATERGLTFHQTLLDKIAERFTGFRVQMTENNRRQAFLPDGAIVIENPVGTAPSFIVEYRDKVVISLPGVPREMKFLLAERVLPYLRERYKLGIIRSRILRTAGIGESSLDDLLGQDLLEASNPTVGLAAHSGVVEIRITATAATELDVDRMIADTEAIVRARAGEHVFGLGKENIEDALMQLLESQDGHLAICEAGISEAATARLARIATANDRIESAHYASPAEVGRLLGLPPEATLLDIAVAQAEQLSAQGALVSIVIVSDPEQQQDHADAEVGTAVAIHCEGQTRSRVYGFGAQADVARQWTSTWALATAWRLLRERVNV